MFPGNGDGTLAPRLDYALEGFAFGVVVGDVNNDSNTDIIVQGLRKEGVDRLTLLLGNGDNTFLDPRNIRVQRAPTGLLLADFNGDGNLDIATSNRGDNSSFITPTGLNDETLAILYSSEDGTFEGLELDFEPLLVQNGSYYAVRTEPTYGSHAWVWGGFDSNELHGSDFSSVSGSGPATPDFSSSGAPITFGFLSLTTNPITRSVALTGGLDNWSVTVTPVPLAPVTVRVEDGRGGFDTQSFTIDVTSPRDVDLTVSEVDQDALLFDGQQLTVSGAISAKIENRGAQTGLDPFHVLFFEDRNDNSGYDPGMDNVLGTSTVAAPLAAGASATVTATLDGPVLFSGNRIWAFADGGQAVRETER